MRRERNSRSRQISSNKRAGSAAALPARNSSIGTESPLIRACSKARTRASKAALSVIVISREPCGEQLTNGVEHSPHGSFRPAAFTGDLQELFPLKPQFKDTPPECVELRHGPFQFIGKCDGLFRRWFPAVFGKMLVVQVFKPLFCTDVSNVCRVLSHLVIQLVHRNGHEQPPQVTTATKGEPPRPDTDKEAPPRGKDNILGVGSAGKTWRQTGSCQQRQPVDVAVEQLLGGLLISGLVPNEEFG